jgi:hypothetical protein
MPRKKKVEAKKADEPRLSQPRLVKAADIAAKSSATEEKADHVIDHVVVDDSQVVQRMIGVRALRHPPSDAVEARVVMDLLFQF